jgi:hypothetical protein
MADLQSAALASWRRRRVDVPAGLAASNNDQITIQVT